MLTTKQWSQSRVACKSSLTPHKTQNTHLYTYPEKDYHTEQNSGNDYFEKIVSFRVRKKSSYKTPLLSHLVFGNFRNLDCKGK